MLTIEAISEKEHRANRVAAALQGVDIDEGKTEETDDVAVSEGSLAMFGLSYEGE